MPIVNTAIRQNHRHISFMRASTNSYSRSLSLALVSGANNHSTAFEYAIERDRSLEIQEFDGETRRVPIADTVRC
jgi:hypothetical protein